MTVAPSMPYWVHGNPVTRMCARCPGRTRPIALAGAKSATSWSSDSGVTTATVWPAATTEPTCGART